MAKAKPNARNTEPAGLWHQPTLLNLLADVLIVAATAGLAWATLATLQRLPVFPLRELVLTEVPRQVSPEQITHAARTAVVGNFFTVDLESARSAFEKLPWVRKASVRRLWPDGLSLHIEEHEAVARWRYPNGDTGLVNRQGEIFAAEMPDFAANLPRLAGPDGSAAEMLARHAEFDTALAGIGRRVDAIVLSPRRAWQLRLDDGVAIELGRDQERHPLTERLARFTHHYDTIKTRLGAIRVADMRYPNGFALAGNERAARPARPDATGRKS